MNNISEILKDFDPKKLQNQEEIDKKSLINQFWKKINECRSESGMGNTNYVNIYLKLRHLSAQDLRWFWSNCLKSNNFSKCFYGSLKVYKHETKSRK